MYKQAMADLHNYVFVWHAVVHIQGREIKSSYISKRAHHSAKNLWQLLSSIQVTFIYLSQI